MVESFKEALENPEKSDLLDKPLLKDLLTFKKSFLSDREIFSITNEGSIEGFTLVKSDFKKIQITETVIPSPEAVQH